MAAAIADTNPDKAAEMQRMIAGLEADEAKKEAKKQQRLQKQGRAPAATPPAPAPAAAAAAAAAQQYPYYAPFGQPNPYLPPGTHAPPPAYSFAWPPPYGGMPPAGMPPGGVPVPPGPTGGGAPATGSATTSTASAGAAAATTPQANMDDIMKRLQKLEEENKQLQADKAHQEKVMEGYKSAVQDMQRKE